jgi:hypothetical protein
MVEGHDAARCPGRGDSGACYLWLMRRQAIAAVFGIALTTAAAATSAIDRDAQASVSIAVTWEGLLRESTAAAVLTPIESRAVWEGGRIYTYTRMRVDRVIAGELATDGDSWVRTMGGVVGQIGQIVEGEAAFAQGQPSLLFLRAGPLGSLDVTARGQGQFPVVAASPSTPAHVVRSRAAGTLLAPRMAASSLATRLAADVLHGRSVDDAAGEVAAAWSRIHGLP